jgi:hypothetical protein
MRPGFVNGYAPIYTRSETHVLPNGDVISINQDIDLTDGPEMRIPAEPPYFKRVEKPTPFFKAMGFEEEIPDAYVQRPLLQTVVYLAQARVTSELSADILGNLVTGDIVEYTMSYNSRSVALLGERPRIKIEAMVPEAPPKQIGGGMNTAYTDSGIDVLEVCTIYFVPPETFAASLSQKATPQQAGTMPGRDWKIYVRHNLFWNLLYISKNDIPHDLPRLRVDPFVSFFVGRYATGPVAALGSLSAAADYIFQTVLNDTSGDGRFWSI